MSTVKEILAVAASERLAAEVKELQARLAVLEERVRLDGVAERFIAGNHEIRDGDCVRFEGGHAAHIRINNFSGKWIYMDGQGRHIEPFRIPPEDNIQRLYTIAEVGEILAKAKP